MLRHPCRFFKLSYFAAVLYKILNVFTEPFARRFVFSHLPVSLMQSNDAYLFVK